MGGLGSGSWTRWNGKPTVEGCVSLDLPWLLRHGLLVPDSGSQLTWRNANGNMVAAAEVFVGPDCGEYMLLTVRGLLGSFDDCEHVLRLRSTCPHFGGRRWWLLCPFCDNRAGKLHWREGHFLCRRCAGLIYYSSKTSHQIERSWRMLGKLVRRQRSSL